MKTTILFLLIFIVFKGYSENKKYKPCYQGYTGFYISNDTGIRPYGYFRLKEKNDEKS